MRETIRPGGTHGSAGRTGRHDAAVSDADVPVRVMARSIAFYEQMGFAARLYADGGYAFLKRDGLELHLAVMKVAEWTFNPTGVYFHVDDVDVLYEEFRAAGVVCLNVPEDRPWRMREFAVSDPDETLLRFGMESSLR